MATWYRDRGYRILDRNWTCRTPELRGEIDIVAERRGVLVFCEVKARSSDAFGGPAAAVGPEKQARVRRLALAYLRSAGTRERSRTLRFDVATLVGHHLEVIEAAF